MANGYKLERGFLFDHRWEKQFRKLKAKDFHKLFWELYDYQVTNGEQFVPDHDENLLMSSIVSFVVPQLKNRLDGAKKTVKSSPAPQEATLPPTPRGVAEATPLKLSEDKLSEVEVSEDKLSTSLSEEVGVKASPCLSHRSAPSDAPLPLRSAPSDAPRVISDDEREDLIKKGIPEGYITERLARAALFAKKQSKRVSAVLLAWWEEDERARLRRPSGRASPSGEGKSYDLDEFAAASFRRALREYENLGTAGDVGG